MKKFNYDPTNKIVENDKEIFDCIKKAEFDMKSYPWPTISENAKKLVRSMLSVNTKNRPIAAAVLSMFLTPVSSVIQRIQRYELQNVVLRLIILILLIVSRNQFKTPT